MTGNNMNMKDQYIKDITYSLNQASTSGRRRTKKKILKQLINWLSKEYDPLEIKQSTAEIAQGNSANNIYLLNL